MKRIISLILIAIYCFIIIGCSNKSIDSDNKEYIFRNIPYGTHYSKAKEILVKELEEEGITKEKYENISRNSISIGFGEVEVAGHKASDLVCIFNSDKNITDNNLDVAVFWSGIYYFERNGEEVNLIYNDLLDKLIKLYGEPTIKRDEKKEIWWSSETEKTAILLKKAESIVQLRYFYYSDDIDNIDKNNNIGNNYNGL